MAVTTVTDSDFNEFLENNSKVIVKYYADWCGACKLFSPKFRRLSEDERFKNVVFINVNAEENEEARKFSQVDSLPFFAIVKQGKLIEGSATSKEENVVGMLEKLS
ncbi:MAG: thioredoxin family protein [Bacteroidota bacterium]|nr:thioredoxin family protein [Bacteroidota bacterium]